MHTLHIEGLVFDLGREWEQYKIAYYVLVGFGRATHEPSV
jgi:hypothetical protein